MPYRRLVVQGSFFGKGFVELCRIHGVDVQCTGIEANSSLNRGARYHQPLRLAYRRLRLEHSAADKRLILVLTVKAMNNTLGSNGVVPSTLVFGEHPPVFIRYENHNKRSTLDDHAKIAFKPLKEM